MKRAFSNGFYGVFIFLGTLTGCVPKLPPTEVTSASVKMELGKGGRPQQGFRRVNESQFYEDSMMSIELVPAIEVSDWNDLKAQRSSFGSTATFQVKVRNKSNKTMKISKEDLAIRDWMGRSALFILSSSLACEKEPMDKFSILPDSTTEFYMVGGLPSELSKAFAKSSYEFSPTCMRIDLFSDAEANKMVKTLDDFKRMKISILITVSVDGKPKRIKFELVPRDYSEVQKRKI